MDQKYVLAFKGRSVAATVATYVLSYVYRHGSAPWFVWGMSPKEYRKWPCTFDHPKPRPLDQPTLDVAKLTMLMESHDTLFHVDAVLGVILMCMKLSASRVLSSRLPAWYSPCNVLAITHSVSCNKWLLRINKHIYPLGELFSKNSWF
jgi:hypothetical protein